MKTLRLTLKKEWFDMFLKSEKKEEYREIKPYWERRLKYSFHPCDFQNYDVIEFTNGYGKDKPQITFECKGVSIGIGNPKWGAPKEEVFIIKIGKEISRKNIKPC